MTAAHAEPHRTLTPAGPGRRHHATVTPLRAFPEPARRGPRATVEPPAWLEDFLNYQRALGIAQTTYLKRRHVIEAFTFERPDFLALTDAQVEEWLDGRPVSRATRSIYRSHLRALLGWAALAGLRPAATLPRRGGPGTASTPPLSGSDRLVLLPVAAQWREPVAAWASWLRAGARSESTVYLREFQVRRLGAELPNLVVCPVNRYLFAGYAGVHESTRASVGVVARAA